jgi:hypothetical protein
VISLLESIALEGLCNLRIALAVGLTSHSQILTYLAALTVEMGAQVVDHLLADAFGLAVTDFVLGSIDGSFVLFQFFKLRGGSLTDGAALGSLGTFVNVAANGTDKLFSHNVFV